MEALPNLVHRLVARQRRGNPEVTRVYSGAIKGRGNVNARWERNTHRPEVDTVALEREIDRLVYELYDLTPEEISIVEGAK